MLLMVMGGGFVGAVTATVFAEQGHVVRLVEPDPARHAALARGEPWFEEPGLADAMQVQLHRGTLHVERRPDPSWGVRATFLCVGTPRRSDGAADLSQVASAARHAAQAMDGPAVLAIKSTVPPGTLRRMQDAVPSEDIVWASVPEFLAEGDALRGARDPERVVVGTDSPRAAEVLHALHIDLARRTVHTTPETAEMIKYASNSFLAARIALTNEVANLCEEVGVHVDDVMGAVGMDPRIGPHFLKAGLGFGGSCFPKDVAALCHLAREKKRPMKILESVLAHNENQPSRVVDLLEQELGPLKGRQVALLGLSFKPGTSDCRESRSLVLYERLREAGASVVAHDPAAEVKHQLPQAVLVSDAADALPGADACVLATAWPEYQDLPWEALLPRMRHPVVIDGWRALDADRMRRSATYRAIGDTRGSDHESRDTSRWDGHPISALHQERA